MAIKTIEYKVTLCGITPATEQFAGTQGDHKVMEIKFLLTDELYSAAITAASNGKLMYRFDIYDGQGGIWSSEAAELNTSSVGIELEERHTRHGGKVTAYLVITSLSADNETDIELYTFPARLRFNDRLSGIAQEGESYESITGLAEVAKTKADEALQSANSAAKSVNNISEIIDSAVSDAVDKASEQAEIAAEHREKAETAASNADNALKDINGAIASSTDQTYNANSKNAQSGKAVAEAVEQLMPKVLPACSEWYDQILVIKDIQHDENGELSYKYSTFPIDQQHEGTSGGLEEPYCIPIRNYNACLTTNYPSDEYDCTNKAYVDGLVGDIETLLGGI